MPDFYERDRIDDAIRSDVSRLARAHENARFADRCNRKIVLIISLSSPLNPFRYRDRNSVGRSIRSSRLAKSVQPGLIRDVYRLSQRKRDSLPRFDSAFFRVGGRRQAAAKQICFGRSL